jgi:hypothetical protein
MVTFAEVRTLRQFSYSTRIDLSKIDKSFIIATVQALLPRSLTEPSLPHGGSHQFTDRPDQSGGCTLHQGVTISSCTSKRSAIPCRYSSDHFLILIAHASLAGASSSWRLCVTASEQRDCDHFMDLKGPPSLKHPARRRSPIGRLIFAQASAARPLACCDGGDGDREAVGHRPTPGDV